LVRIRDEGPVQALNLDRAAALAAQAAGSPPVPSAGTPYKAPVAPEVCVDTARHTAEAAARQILRQPDGRGFPENWRALDSTIRVTTERRGIEAAPV